MSPPTPSAVPWLAVTPLAGPPLAGPPRVAVDPASLEAAARVLCEAGAHVRAALPDLLAAWGSAAHGLAPGLTGEALAVAKPAAAGLVGGCGDTLDALGLALRRAAGAYRGADVTAVRSAGFRDGD